MIGTNNEIWAVDAIAEAAAELSHEAGPPTREERANEAQYRAFVVERLAALRRAALARVPAIGMQVRPVRASILAMTRDAVIARLDAIRAAHPGVILGFAYHKHAGGEMSDGDLRSALEDAERAIESD